MSNRLFINPDIFFFLDEGKVFLWDYKNHTQFEIEDEFFHELQKISKGTSFFEDKPVQKELLENNVASIESYTPVAWGWDKLSYIFHKGTSDLPKDEAEQNSWLGDYLDFCINHPSKKQKEEDHQILTLPIPPTANFSIEKFSTVLFSRKTVRQFVDKPINLDTFSQLLFFSFGYIHGPWKELEDANLQTPFKRKSSPSGGCLHPIDVFIFLHNIENIESGLYKYLPQKHALKKIGSAEQNMFVEALQGQDFFINSSAMFILSANFSASWEKYHHSRAYRVILLDAGHLSQTFQLVATSLGLQSWITANFSESMLTSIFNNEDMNPLMLLSTGFSQGEALPASFYSAEKT